MQASELREGRRQMGDAAAVRKEDTKAGESGKEGRKSSSGERVALDVELL